MAEERLAISTYSIHRWMRYKSVVGIRVYLQASFAVVFQIWEITWNSEKIRTYSSSRSSKVLEFGANQTRMQLHISH